MTQAHARLSRNLKPAHGLISIHQEILGCRLEILGLVRGCVGVLALGITEKILGSIFVVLEGQRTGVWLGGGGKGKQLG